MDNRRPNLPGKDFCPRPISRQYIGARYVPIFDGEWDDTKDYEPLVIVSYHGNSYTSRSYVPAGVDIENETYWALTGNYNAQVEYYRQLTQTVKENMDSLVVNVLSFGAKIDGFTDDTDAVQSAIDSIQGGVVYIPPGTCVVSSIKLRNNITLKGGGKTATIIKRSQDSTDDVITTEDFEEAVAEGDTEKAVYSASIMDLCVDGGKSYNVAVNSGITYYGEDLYISNVAVRNNNKYGIHTESIGGIYSLQTNLQNSFEHIELFDNTAGNLYYNGQSDSNLFDILCYRTGEGNGQFNAKFGAKANGCRVFGLHCWGTSDYGLINQGAHVCFTNCHIETANVCQCQFHIATSFEGRIYLNNFSNDSYGIELVNSCAGCRINASLGRIKTMLKLTSSGGHHVIMLKGYNGADSDAQIVSGTPSVNDYIDAELWGAVNDWLISTPAQHYDNTINKQYSKANYHFLRRGNGTPTFGVETSENSVGFLSVIGGTSNEAIGGKLVVRGSGGSDIAFVPKEGGYVRFGDYEGYENAQTNYISDGYIDIKDSNGIVRHIPTVRIPT